MKNHSVSFQSKGLSLEVADGGLSDNGINPSVTSTSSCKMILQNFFPGFITTVEIIPLLLFASFAFGQPDSAHHKIFYAIINQTNGNHSKNILLDVTDSALLLLSESDSTQYLLSYHEIEKIKIRKKGSIGTGILIGTGSGVLLGAVIGAATYQPPEQTNSWAYGPDFGPGGSAAAGGFLGAIGGLITGAIIGSLPATTFKVHHNYQLFSSSIPEIKKYSSSKNKN